MNHLASIYALARVKLCTPYLQHIIESFLINLDTLFSHHGFSHYFLVPSPTPSHIVLLFRQSIITHVHDLYSDHSHAPRQTLINLTLPLNPSTWLSFSPLTLFFFHLLAFPFSYSYSSISLFSPSWSSSLPSPPLIQSVKQLPKQNLATLPWAGYCRVAIRPLFCSSCLFVTAAAERSHTRLLVATNTIFFLFMHAQCPIIM